MITIVGDRYFEEEVMGSDRPVVVDFYADWCAPCRRLGPILEALAVQYGERVKFAKVNVSTERGLAARFDVSSVPTLLLVRDGAIEGRWIGLGELAALKSELDRIVGSPVA